MAADELHVFAADIKSIANALSGDALKSAMVKAGERLTKVADGALAGELGGDGKFSGWPRPGQMRTKSTVHPDGKGVTIHRDKRSAGVIRVAEEGRHGQRSLQGPSINRRTGETYRTKTGRVAAGRRPGRAKRYNGVTKGKGSWTSAEAAVDAAAPKAVEDGVLDVVMKLWGG